MSIENIIHEKYSIAAGAEFTQKRYGLKSCKKVKDASYLKDIKDIYMYQKEKEGCGENTGCNCSVSKLEDLIKTV